MTFFVVMTWYHSMGLVQPEFPNRKTNFWSKSLSFNWSEASSTFLVLHMMVYSFVGHFFYFSLISQLPSISLCLCSFNGFHFLFILSSNISLFKKDYVFEILFLSAS